MGQRKNLAPPKAPTEFKYESVVDCEINEDNHVVEPDKWPPPRLRHSTEDPSIGLRCKLCGCWCVVYEAHATGALKGVRVILPKKANTA